MGLDPIQAKLPFPGRTNSRPARRNVAEGRPERMLPFTVQEDAVIDGVAVKRIGH